MGEIKRTVTRTYKIVDVGLDMFTYDEEFVRIRSGLRRKYSHCFDCGRHFQLGEKTSIAIVENCVNQMLCHECAVKHKETK